jgi:2-aminoadipate transaminase
MTYERFLSRGAQAMRESAIRKMGGVAARVPDLISFAAGYPDPGTFPWEAFREITNELLDGHDPNALQYGATRGYHPLVDDIGHVLESHGIQSTFEERLVTTGSQQGLDLVGRLLIDPGDVILVELPTYTGAISAFRNAQAEMVGVQQEGDGIDVAALDSTLQALRSAGRRVKFLYVVPNFQNPAGLLIGLEKRRRLLEWAERRDVLLVEDDPYGELYFPDRATREETRPIKADDTTGRVIYLSSFSKTLAPGFRVAWVVAPAEMIAKFDLAKQAADICAGALDQRVIHQAIRRGVLTRQGERLRAHYQHKRKVMEGALAEQLGAAMSCTTPRGGFFLWGRLVGGLDANAVLAHALDAKVSFVIGSAFYVDDSGHDTLRLSFSQPSDAELVEGVARLAAAIAIAEAAPRR